MITRYQRINTFTKRKGNGVEVFKKPKESDEDFLKRFRKTYQKSGLAKEIKERMYFEKPSVKKKRKINENKKLLEERKEREDV